MEKVKVFDYPVAKPQTLRERIVEFVKDSITSGRLKPGEKVAEQEIAKSLGISRTPIREAFRQLESEGFITVIPRKGAFVTPITAKDVREFYEIKSLLEGYAAKEACRKFTDKDIKKLKTLNEQMARCVEKKSGDVRGFLKLDNQFHEVFMSACHNEKLCKMAHQIVEQFGRFRAAALSVPGRMRTSIKQHKEIVQAFEDRDAGLAERLVRENAGLSAEILIKELLKESS